MQTVVGLHVVVFEVLVGKEQPFRSTSLEKEEEGEKEEEEEEKKTKKKKKKGE